MTALLANPWPPAGQSSAQFRRCQSCRRPKFTPNALLTFRCPRALPAARDCATALRACDAPPAPPRRRRQLPLAARARAHTTRLDSTIWPAAKGRAHLIYLILLSSDPPIPLVHAAWPAWPAALCTACGATCPVVRRACADKRQAMVPSRRPWTALAASVFGCLWAAQCYHDAPACPPAMHQPTAFHNSRMPQPLPIIPATCALFHNHPLAHRHPARLPYPPPAMPCQRASVAFTRRLV